MSRERIVTRISRRELIRTIGLEARRNSTRTVLFHTAVAERLGLNPSDHKCADILAGPVTPGRLAELTGLKTGAITGVLDRLEQAGFIVRRPDPNDRRRTLVHLTPERTPDLTALFAPLAAGLCELCARYTVEQLEVIRGYMAGCTEVLQDATAKLRAPARAPTSDGPGAKRTRPT
jgi:DNA-binding MarR family transcriptional regulator